MITELFFEDEEGQYRRHRDGRLVGESLLLAIGPATDDPEPVRHARRSLVLALTEEAEESREAKSIDKGTRPPPRVFPRRESPPVLYEGSWLVTLHRCETYSVLSTN